MSVPTFLGLPAAAFAYARAFARNGNRVWASSSAGSGLVMLVFFGLSTAGFSQVPALVSWGGHFQRACVITGFTWLTALAASALHRQSECD